MRIMFMGTTPFSCVVLQQLIDDGYEICAVVTQPDRPFGRKRVLKASPVKEMAIERNIPILQPEVIKASVDEILVYKPDLILTCAYGQIVPKAILDYPIYKCLNVHASLLPKYRGGAPIHWSIINGENETGVTLMHMDVGMDSGAMLAKRTVTIEPNDVFGDVEAKLMEVSKDLIHIELKRYINGELEAIEQNASEVTFAYTIQRDDEYISFNRDVQEVYNHIRGLIPWPVGYGIVDGKRVKLHASRIIKNNHNYPAGLIVEVSEDAMKVACINGYVLIQRLQLEGKPVMDLLSFYNGNGKAWIGKVFE